MIYHFDMIQKEVENWCEDNGFVLINIKRDDIPPEVVLAVAKQSCFLSDSIFKRTQKQEYVFARFMTIYYYEGKIPPVALSKIFSKNHSTIWYACNVMKDDFRFFKSWQKEAIKHFKTKMKEIEALYEKN